MANNNDNNLMHVFGALDKVLADKDTEILILQYEVEDLKRKLAAAEASKTKAEDESEVA